MEGGNDDGLRKTVRGLAQLLRDNDPVTDVTCCLRSLCEVSTKGFVISILRAGGTAMEYHGMKGLSIE